MDEIHYLHYEPTIYGKSLAKEPNVIKIDGKIKKIVPDEEKFNGIYLLIAKEQSSKLQEQKDGDTNTYNTMKLQTEIAGCKYVL